MTHINAHLDVETLDGPFVFLDDSQTPAPRFYHSPRKVIRADHPDDVEAAFAQLKDAHEAGYYLAGYISYELGLSFEDKLAARLDSEREHPLICFGVFDRFNRSAPPELLYTATPKGVDVTPAWSKADYLKRFAQVKDYLRRGDCYQINLTFPMRGTYDGDPIALYASLRHRQRAKYGGFVRLGGPDLLSLSPELFFKKDGQNMSMRPMKGTLKRNSNMAIDTAQRDAMATDSKSRAENLMIVDLLRNDLSRLSKPGSVRVPELFALETYPTLHQMTSRVVSELRQGTTFRDLFQSLFPCGSVTGAPKIRAMEIIDELEDYPRGAYCGALGFVDPDGAACFNVGIRTLSLNGKNVTYPVGSGVVMDSHGIDEYAECLLKADVLAVKDVSFIETIYWDSQVGYRNIGYHLTRLSKAVGDNERMDNVIKTLADYSPVNNPARIRLSVDNADKIDISDTAFTPFKTPVKLAVSKHRLTPARQITAHKVSARDFYDGERSRLNRDHNIDEAIFLNEKDELCEGSFTSLFLEKDGRLLTPHISCGLLPGVLRACMISTGQAEQAILKLEDLEHADAVYVGNSLRGLMPATLVFTEA